MVTRGKAHADITSTTRGRKRKMGVDQENAGTMMLMFSQVYSASGESVLREYANNGRDSHVEAGQERPIEVTLPTTMNPHLVVRDYGIGLTSSGVVDTFTYGRSSKRGSDRFTGHFGIGSKSAFTLASQFSVTAVKDGRRTVVLVSLDEDGEPSTEVLSGENPGSGDDILSSDPTDEPNGVTISIPIDHDHAETMRASVPKVFGLWPRGAVLVDGSEPEDLRASAQMSLGPLTMFNPDGVKELGLGHLTIEMGGSLYGVPDAVRDEFVQSFRGGTGTTVSRMRDPFIAHVPMDAVDLVPTREDVRDTPKTRRAVKAAAKEALAEAVERAKSLAGVSLTERGKAMVELSHSYFSPHVRDILQQFAGDGHLFQDVRGRVYRREGIIESIEAGKPLRSDSTEVSVGGLDDVTFVVGASAGNARAVLKKWVHSGKSDARKTVALIEADSFQLLGAEVSASETGGLHVVDYGGLRKFTKVVLPAAATKGEIVYPVRRLGGRFSYLSEDNSGAMTPSEIAEAYASGGVSEVVIQDSYYYASGKVSPVLEERARAKDALFVLVDLPRTPSAFIARLRRFDESIPVRSLADFRDKELVPVLRPLIEEAQTPNYTRPGIAIGLAERLDEIDPVVREYIETRCPHALRDPKPVSALVSNCRDELVRLGGKGKTPVTFFDLTLGSEMVKGVLTLDEKQVSDGLIDDVIAVLNSRREIAERRLSGDSERTLAAAA